MADPCAWVPESGWREAPGGAELAHMNERMLAALRAGTTVLPAPRTGAEHRGMFERLLALESHPDGRPRPTRLDELAVDLLERIGGLTAGWLKLRDELLVVLDPLERREILVGALLRVADARSTCSAEERPPVMLAALAVAAGDERTRDLLRRNWRDLDLSELPSDVLDLGEHIRMARLAGDAAHEALSLAVTPKAGQGSGVVVASQEPRGLPPRLHLRAADLDKVGHTRKGKIRGYVDSPGRPFGKGGLPIEWVRILQELEKGNALETTGPGGPRREATLKRLRGRMSEEGWGFAIEKVEAAWIASRSFSIAFVTDADAAAVDREDELRRLDRFD